MSYRVISKQVGERYGKRVSPPQNAGIEVKREYKHRWEDYLTVDDKSIRIKGKKYPSLVAVDRLAYSFNSITTDLDPMLEKAIRIV